jgi:hypothetical protein
MAEVRRKRQLKPCCVGATKNYWKNANCWGKTQDSNDPSHWCEEGREKEEVVAAKNCHKKLRIDLSFFFDLSPFTTPGLPDTLRSACFFLFFFPYVVRRGSGGTLSSPFSFLDDTTRIQPHNIHGRPIRPGFEPCRPRGGVGRVSLFLPLPYRLPLKDIHTHPWPGGGSFLGKNPPPSVRFEPTSAGTATSEHCLRQPCGHRATFFLMLLI